MKILVGFEESQAVTKELRLLGVEAYSCDLKDCSGGRPDWHLKMDVFEALEITEWDAAFFFPPCTYLTCSAEWAYKDPNFEKYPNIGYHQKVKSTTLTGRKRRKAREDAINTVRRLWDSCNHVAIENPVGVLSSEFQKPSQVIQPHQFGDDASKKTCLWLKNLPLLEPTKDIAPRMVNDKPRWANQTDSGQNRLSPSENRAELRSKTYPGIARAMAEQWIKVINSANELGVEEIKARRPSRRHPCS